MRIIAGKAGRIAIKVPSEVARPTTDFLRQAIYSILGETIIHARVLDLFCGSGALGLEALSRGATSCTFVDEHRRAIAVTQENLKKTHLEGGHTIRSEAFHFLKRDTCTYDLILADPPYSCEDLDRLEAEILEIERTQWDDSIETVERQIDAGTRPDYL